MNSPILGMADAAYSKRGKSSWDFSPSNASTTEPADGDVWFGSDSEDEKEVDVVVEEKKTVQGAVLSVLLLALLVLLSIPAMIFAPIVDVRFATVRHGLSLLLPLYLCGWAVLCGIVLLPLYLCGWAVFLTS